MAVKVVRKTDLINQLNSRIWSFYLIFRLTNLPRSLPFKRKSIAEYNTYRIFLICLMLFPVTYRLTFRFIYMMTTPLLYGESIVLAWSYHFPEYTDSLFSHRGQFIKPHMEENYIHHRRRNGCGRYRDSTPGFDTRKGSKRLQIIFAKTFMLGKK